MYIPNIKYKNLTGEILADYEACIAAQMCPDGFYKDPISGNCISTPIDPFTPPIIIPPIIIPPIIPPSCQTGYHIDSSGNCVPDVLTCSPGYHKDSFGNCITDAVSCQIGYHKDNFGNCVVDVFIPDCPNGSHLVGGVCVKDIPIVCQLGYHFDSIGNCIPDVVSCQSGYHKDSSGNCIIDVNDVLCNTGYHKESGLCVKDTPIVVPCSTGFHKDIAGNCVTDAVIPDNKIVTAGIEIKPIYIIIGIVLIILLTFKNK